MKRTLSAVLCLLALLTVCCAAGAEPVNPLKIRMELSATKFTGPQEITVVITAANTGGEPMLSPVVLYDPAGAQIAVFGDPVLQAGETGTWTGTWTVTEAQLAAGKITFSMRYTLPTDGGDTVNKEIRFSKLISLVDTPADPYTPAPAEETPDAAEPGLLIVTLSNEGSGEWRLLNEEEPDAVRVSAEVFGGELPGDPMPWDLPGERLWDFRITAYEFGDETLFLGLIRDGEVVRWLRLEIEVDPLLNPSIAGMELHAGNDWLPE